MLSGGRAAHAAGGGVTAGGGSGAVAETLIGGAELAVGAGNGGRGEVCVSTGGCLTCGGLRCDGAAHDVACGTNCKGLCCCATWPTLSEPSKLSDRGRPCAEETGVEKAKLWRALGPEEEDGCAG